MDIRVIVGKNLRRVRLLRGFSQEALAHEAGIAPSFLSQIENGKRSATITTLDVLAKALKTPIVDFFAPPTAVPKGLPRGKRTP
jgi:transcriptional regulator with XRE-family HTH domain